MIIENSLEVTERFEVHQQQKGLSPNRMLSLYLKTVR